MLIDTQGVDKILAAQDKVMTATYKYPYQMHGSMGTSAAVADVRADSATIWTSAQGVYQLRGALATLLNMEARKIRVVYVEGSGCYGMNGADNVALDAALMSQAVGKPVRVQYLRGDEHGWENYGNAIVVKYQAALDSKKTVQANFVKPLPVYIVYFSSAALLDGSIVDYKDLYGRDSLALAALEMKDGGASLAPPKPKAADVAPETVKEDES